MRFSAIFALALGLMGSWAHGSEPNNRVLAWKKLIRKSGFAPSFYSLKGVRGDYSHWLSKDGSKSLVVYQHDQLGSSVFQIQADQAWGGGRIPKLMLNEGVAGALPSLTVLELLGVDIARSGPVTFPSIGDVTGLQIILQDPEAPDELKQLAAATLYREHKNHSSNELFPGLLPLAPKHIKRAYSEDGIEGLPTVATYLRNKSRRVLVRRLRPFSRARSSWAGPKSIRSSRRLSRTLA